MRTITQCPACEGKEHQTVVTIDPNRKKSYLQFSELKYDGLLDMWLEEINPEIAACSACGHYWYVRQPSDEQLSQMYCRGKKLIKGKISREPTADMLQEMHRLNQLTVGKARLLDYGSGFGRWARAAARNRFHVIAYEPSQERGKEEIDEFTLIHNLESIKGEKFEAINLEQVLEHVASPADTLKTLIEFMTPDSIIRIRVPNLKRPPEGKQVWNDWPYNGKRVHIMAPYEHLHGFTPLSLNRLVDRVGLRALGWHEMLSTHPKLVMRNVLAHLHPGLGQTMVLAKLSD